MLLCGTARLIFQGIMPPLEVYPRPLLPIVKNKRKCICNHFCLFSCTTSASTNPPASSANSAAIFVLDIEPNIQWATYNFTTHDICRSDLAAKRNTAIKYHSTASRCCRGPGKLVASSSGPVFEQTAI